MTDEPWRAALDDMETTVIAATMTADGARWPAIAVACALIDNGLIDKARLLAIIDALHSIVLTRATMEIGGPEDAAQALEAFRAFLEQSRLEPGQVLPELEARETAEHRAERHRREPQQRKNE